MTIDANGFDRDFYLSRNLDVAAAGLDPYQHYLTYGWREGRDPNAIFDTSYYLATNRDVAASGLDPLDHYVRYGAREGRDPSIAFDTSSYLTANRDVAAAGANPLVHYLQYGQFEHRALTLDLGEERREGFDRAYYLKANPDVAAAGADAYIHYQSYGYAEGRQPNALFDKGFYLAQNPDVAAAGVDAFQHFLTYGWREGRDPSAGFSLSEYRAANSTAASQNPLVRYLDQDRYQSLPFEFLRPDPPQILQARGNPLSVILAGEAVFQISGALTHVTAAASPLDGHDLAGFDTFGFSSSTADITIAGAGPLPSRITLGTGDDRISGVFDLGGRLANLSGGAGRLFVDAQIDNGSMGIVGGAGVSTVLTRGTAKVFFTGKQGNDMVSLGAADDSLSGGTGFNHLDGGAGADTASWDMAVKVDLSAGRAFSLSGSAVYDTLVSIENVRGSAFDDILVGDDSGNVMDGGSARSRPLGMPTTDDSIYGPGGNDIIAGGGGDDTLQGREGNDLLIGGRGADTLIGGVGNDLLIDAADPWGPNRPYPEAFGGDGNDRLVFLFGAVGPEERGCFMAGGAGADTFIFDPMLGQFGSVGLEFSQIDGDKIDFSALRTASGGTVTLDYVRQSAFDPFSTSATIDLAAYRDAAGRQLSGRIVINGGITAADLNAEDFIFSGLSDWRSAVPADLFGLI